MNCRATLQSEGDDRFLIDPQAAIRELCHLIEHHMPAMAPVIRQPDADEYILGADNQSFITSLYQAIEYASPEAGRFYWAAQSWNMLTWQPIILTLASVSLFNLAPDFSRIGIRLQGEMAAGLSLGENAFSDYSGVRAQVGSTDIFCDPAHHLKTFLEQSLNDISVYYPINRNLARRLFADRVLSTLLLLQSLSSQSVATATQPYARLLNTQTEALAEYWLQALELEGASSLMRIPFQSDAFPEGERLALNRKGCCQHFRKADGEVCASCPKNKIPERIRLIQESWSQA
ncbi:siderophore ferric iron reductase [Oceanospirillum sp.]|uniref:siderophore ferric iron reductase n=1 Tax=Oceanospirillum sp. TaxID=2021254 RepID=UPI003A8D3C3B